MVKLVCLNGISLAGKDTFVDYVEETVGYNYVWRISTIDPIKELYSDFFLWNEAKTPQDRKNLNVLKNMWREKCNGPINFVKEYLEDLNLLTEGYLFVTVREFEEMLDIKKMAIENGNTAYTLKVVRDVGGELPPVEQEFLDSHTADYQYDIVINNPTDENYHRTSYPELPELRKGVRDFLSLTRWYK